MRATFEIRASSDAAADRIFEQVQLRVTRGDGELTVGEPRSSFGSIVSRIFGDGSQASLTVEAEIPAAAQLHLSLRLGRHRSERHARRAAVQHRLGRPPAAATSAARSASRRVSGDANLRTDEPIAVQAQGVSGDVSIMAPLLRSLTANTVSGDVELDAELDARGDFRVETVSGDLAVGLIGSATFEVHGLSTDVHSELDHRLEGQVGRSAADRRQRRARG